MNLTGICMQTLWKLGSLGGCKMQKKVQRDNGQCLPGDVTSPNHAYLKKTLGPSVIYSMPTGRPVGTSEFFGPGSICGLGGANFIPEYSR